MSEAATFLTLINAELTRRLSPGGGTEEWSEGSERFRLMPTKELMALRKQFQAEAAAESGGSFYLYTPMGE